MTETGPPAFWSRLDRDVVTVSGPEAAAYLQGQLSQDLLALGDGACTWSWILAPNGKVDALVRVWRMSAEGWLLDTDGGWGERVAERLNRFKLRTKAEIRLAHEATLIAVRGPGWQDALGAWGAPFVASPAWPDGSGADLLWPLGRGPQEPVPPDGRPELDVERYEIHRIAAGLPRMGAELTERTIPAETGLVPVTVSFTKGCYTGQELVARLDARGSNVARRLWRLAFDGPVEAGAALAGPEGAVAGEVTSAAHSETEGWVGLGYVKRGVGTERPLDAAGVATRLVSVPW